MLKRIKRLCAFGALLGAFGGGMGFVEAGLGGGVQGHGLDAEVAVQAGEEFAEEGLESFEDRSEGLRQHAQDVKEVR